MKEFLKFNEWKQQAKPQFDYENYSDDDSIVRLSDGMVFVKGDIVSTLEYVSKYFIFKFHPNMIHVELVIYPNGHMRQIVPANQLIKRRWPNS